MSSDVQQSGLAVAPGGSDATDVVPRPPDALPPEAILPSAPADPNPSDPAQPAAPALPATPIPKAERRRRIGLTLGGYLLLLAATALAIALPRMKLKAGFGEDLLVILSIAGMVTGTAMTFVSLAWNILRQ